MKIISLFIGLWLVSCQALFAQPNANWWHGIERSIHYKPDGEDFLLVKGQWRFNRALYGGNTAFRVEAGDLPEFALYLPGMGGNLKFGLINGTKTKWLIEADKIESRYRPGSMIYTISDSLLGKGILYLSVLASFETEAIIVKAEGINIPAGVSLFVAYGGATGSKFSRDGDIGADPESSFYLKPEYCNRNVYQVSKNEFTLYFGSKSLSEEDRYEIQNGKRKDTASLPHTLKRITGIFPEGMILKTADAGKQQEILELYHAADSLRPLICGRIPLLQTPYYFYLQNGQKETSITYKALSSIFLSTEKKRQELAGRIKLKTPDPFINTFGAALSMAADAIWEAPSYMHGAVAWRMRLNGWRGAYTADVLGWHDRARQHFDGYALSQLTSPLTGPVVMDTALNLARGLEKLGTSLFSSGYISRNPGGDKRPHHYDMNLVFIDQLLNHFNWTGDTAYLRKMWPVIVRHLDWEKRNFDPDDDGLYDAYAAIWASDALQYSGGSVTHSSAYNYRAYKMAATLASFIGENGTPYEIEANKIQAAMNAQLWLKDKGWYAEYKDLMGEKLLHPAAGLWTIYHSIDAYVPDAFQNYQLLQYVMNELPHIPVRAKGLADTSLYAISTTNWQPYTWSLNNVAEGELFHMALAFWQGANREEAFRLWKSNIIQSMYIGASPGNFEQVSFYDAMRGELYRDFADVIGTASRSLVEGLFGIEPDLFHKKIAIHPGFPESWDHASLSTPDFNYNYHRIGNKDQYAFTFRLPGKNAVHLFLRTKHTDVSSVMINGKSGTWHFDSSAVGSPVLEINTPPVEKLIIVITWKKTQAETTDLIGSAEPGGLLLHQTKKATILRVYDPQECISNVQLEPHRFKAKMNVGNGYRAFFLQVKQDRAVYWVPVAMNMGKQKQWKPMHTRDHMQYEKIDLSAYYNDDVKSIFKNKYLSPRPTRTTLQLPVQGIGNWAYPQTLVNINDSGLRRKAGTLNEIRVDGNIPFATPSAANAKNILFTSQWDNYPKEATIPLSGKASIAYLMMAGSTNPMQSRLVNGKVLVTYMDGSSDVLELRNPENWNPIEQDYYDDGYAFTTDAPKWTRISLLTGEEIKNNYRYTTIKGFSNRGIEGGAATILNMPLDNRKQLKSITVKSMANDVVIGLMALTLGKE